MALSLFGVAAVLVGVHHLVELPRPLALVAVVCGALGFPSALVEALTNRAVFLRGSVATKEDEPKAYWLTVAVLAFMTYMIVLLTLQVTGMVSAASALNVFD